MAGGNTLTTGTQALTLTPKHGSVAGGLLRAWLTGTWQIKFACSHECFMENSPGAERGKKKPAVLARGARLAPVKEMKVTMEELARGKGKMQMKLSVAMPAIALFY